MPVKARAGGQGRVRTGRVGAQQGTGGTPSPPTQDPSVGFASGAATVSGVGSSSGGSSLVFSTDFTSISSLPAEISLSRSTTGTYFDASGVLQTAATNAARFDHDQSTHAAKGILIEEQRTNILTQSNNFTNSQWVLMNAAVAASSNNSPDGTTDAFTLTIAPSAGSIIYNPLSATSGTYTGIIWARVTSATGKVYINLNNAGNVNQSVTACSLTTSWQRFSVTYAHPSTSTMYFCIGQKSDGSTTDASSSVEIFGGQVELGSSATSYIPATTAAATRSADIPSSNSPLTGYLTAGPSVWEFQDEATGTIARSAYAANAFDWPVNKWYRSMGVYTAGTDTSGHMTVGSPY